MQFELIFKYLLRGQHLIVENESESTNQLKNKSNKVASLKQAINRYQQNWLSISGQKLFSNSLSHYLHNLCPHQSAIGRQYSVDSDSMSSLEELPLTCKCHSAYYLSYLEYLSDARYAINHNRASIKHWKNAYTEPCFRLKDVHEQSIIFCTVEGNLNNNDAKSDNFEENSINELVIDANGGMHHSKPVNGQSNGVKLKNGYSKDRVINRNDDPFAVHGNGNGNGVAVDVVASMFEEEQSPPLIGLFLNTLLTRVAQFFENDVLTNLHLTGLLTTLSQSPHKLLLSLFFDETLARLRGVPCLLHLLQKLSLDAQSFLDEIPNFEATFQSAKSNLQSVPIGELNCQLLTGNHHQQNKARSTSFTQFPKSMNIEGILFSIIFVLR